MPPGTRGTNEAGPRGGVASKPASIQHGVKALQLHTQPHAAHLPGCPLCVAAAAPNAGPQCPANCAVCGNSYSCSVCAAGYEIKANGACGERTSALQQGSLMNSYDLELSLPRCNRLPPRRRRARLAAVKAAAERSGGGGEGVDIGQVH